MVVRPRLAGLSPSTRTAVRRIDGSSRFWSLESHEPGHAQASFDKQPLRDYLAAEKRAGRWDGNYPPPPLPKDVIDATSQRYLEIYRRLTGIPLNTDGAN